MRLQDSPLRSGDEPLVLPFTALHRSMLALAGGKAANLGELVHAKLPVPAGFCLTTVAYALAAEQAGLDSVLTRSSLETIPPPPMLAQAARDCLFSTPIPPIVARAIAEAYQALGDGKALPVTV